MKVYFAHPVNEYGTDREQVALTALQERFPEAWIINPNGADHEKNYKIQGMSYFEDIIEECDVVVGMPFKDGEFGMGVYTEMVVAGRDGKEVFWVTWDCVLPCDYTNIRPLSISETRNRVRNKK